MRFLTLGLFVVLSTLMITGCVSPAQSFEKIPPGIWRGVLMLDRQPVQVYGDDRDIVKKFDPEAELPFNFDVVYDSDTTFHIVIHNAEERILVKDIRYGRDPATAKDTVVIDFPVYDTQIKAIYEDGVMEGDWIVNYRENYKIPFKAFHGESQRFLTVSNLKASDFSGNWACIFDEGSEDAYKATGLFEQKNDLVTGTFLTETGDYRFLEGKVNGNKLYMSAFDGAHAYLFLARTTKEGIISGTFRSGSHYTTGWAGEKDKASNLRQPDSLTTMNRNEPLQMVFPDINGRVVDISDQAYAGKIKIIQIMGTWCPNCMDETIFLKDYLKENTSKDIALFSVGFERYKDSLQNLKALKRFKEKMDLNHDVLYGGYYDKKAASAVFPQLNKISSYPTLIIADKKNRVTSIHTGFSGPATPEYASFRDKFEQMILKARNNR
jgi:thiol-disulfide isomerase/thioredoxin